MKKDYLEEGAMADTADLVVLGAYYGTGNKGEWCVYIMTSFSKTAYSVSSCCRPRDLKRLRQVGCTDLIKRSK